jgi:exodeoxyribonuclease V beta subunit
MSKLTELDVFSCALGGATLIEASAGTGKTWNICGLYLRLLLERELGVQQILVVTFTNAATAELRERIRARIGDALTFLQHSGAPATDPFVPALVQSVEQGGMPRERMAQLLEQALQAFDEAAIFTIHGFCQRALADTPFAAGMPFATELVPDDRAQLQEAVNDFWRREIGSDRLAPELAAYLLDCKDTPQRLVRLLKRHLAKPAARILWPEPQPLGADGTDAAATRIVQIFADAKAAWQTEAAAIHTLLEHALPDLKGTDIADRVAAALAECDTFFAANEAPPLPPTLRNVQMKLLRQSALATATRSKRSVPAHPFFEQLESLLDTLPPLQQQCAGALAAARLELLRAMLEQAAPALRRRKRELRIAGYDDLLYNVYDALCGGRFPWLAAALRTRYPAALIDEFQDTDPLQFAIFDAIYDGSEAPLFLVGDPKQAIYSFRNADLHTYLRAKRKTGAAHTLSANQRSSAGLIAGLNALFGANPAAFMLAGLDYQQVKFGDKPRQPFVDNSDQPCADLQLWLLPAADGAVMRRGAAKQAAITATAAEIARLLDAANRGRITLGGRPLQPGDIAVLIRSHAQGSEMRAALAALDIGSVELSQASVFASDDAADLECVLSAILEPTRTGLLLAALATPLLGCDAGAIAAIGANEQLLTARLDQFAGYQDIWFQRGVGFMFRQLLTDENVSRRLLGRADGERRLTNLLHLGEQLHQTAQHMQTPAALLRWLQEQRREAASGNGSGDEATQLRLESDENLVQIVTVHKSKGLEYPVVFCPLLWDGHNSQRGGVEGLEYHAEDGAGVIDFRSDAATVEQARAAIKHEQAAENLRLIYVALTRAAQRCYLVAGSYAKAAGKGVSLKEGTRNLLNWMVAGAGMTPQEWFEADLQPAAIDAAWQALAQAQPAIGLAPLPVAAGRPLAFARPAAEALAARTPPAPIQAGWRVGSFTLLSHGTAPERAASDHDARIAAPARTVLAAPAGSDDILHFPRGPAAGDCLHAVFETIDFGRPQGWEQAIAQALAAHPQPAPSSRPAPAAGKKVAEDWPATQRAMILRMLRDVLATPLADGIRLQAVAPAQRLTELEFHLPSPQLDAGKLNQLLRRAGYDVPELAFRDLAGYLHGFIDLVFEHGGRYYLLDWKSNHLGYQPDDYGQQAMAAAMAEHRYHLQYLLYAVALQRYLQHRLPDYDAERDFGGVLYLFVRGVRPEWTLADGSQAGVFFHRPSAATLSAMQRLVAPARRKERA